MGLIAFAAVLALLIGALPGWLGCGGCLRLCIMLALEFLAILRIHPSTYPTKGIPDVH